MDDSNAFPAKGGRIYETYGDNPALMAKRLLEAAGVARAIPAGAGVCLKPNLVVGRPASEGATTHPEILAGIIEHLRDHGHTRIDIIEGAWLGEDTVRAFAACGMNDLARRYGVGLHDLKKDASKAVETPMGKIAVCRRALDAGFLINIPVMKGHCQTRMTCALKNMKGCIPDSEKRRFHRDGLDECIAALAAAVVPNVSIVDGICGDLDFEEGGNPVRSDRMLLGADPVKLDAWACSLMGLAPEEVGYIALAEKHGVGEARVAGEDVVRLNRPAPGAAAGASGKVRRLARGVREDRACSACYANVIRALGRLEERGAELPEVFVGQGWRGKRMRGLGAGRCCEGAERHVPGCPPEAVAIVRALRMDR